MKRARHQARACAVQSLYQWILSGGASEDIEQEAQAEPSFEKIDQAYFKTLLHAILKDIDTLNKELTRFIDRPISELFPVEHAILLVCIQELAQHHDVPYRVVINEGVELAKTFGSVEGYKYVNGVLNKAASHLRATEVQAAAPRSLKSL